MRVGELLLLSQEEICELGGLSIELYLEALETAYLLHEAKDISQPLKPYLRKPDCAHVADRIIAMPAYLGGEVQVAGIKWIGSAASNQAKGLPRATALIVLNDPETNIPVAVLDGTVISAMRTAGVAALACENLAKEEATCIGLIGNRVIGDRCLRGALAVRPSLRRVVLFDLDPEASRKLAEEIARDFDVSVEIALSAEDLVRGVDIVLTATTAGIPYIEGDWIQQGQLLCNISIMDFKSDALLRSDKLIVDDWEQCNREGKVIHQMTQAGQLKQEDCYAEFSEIVAGRKPGRQREEEIIFFNPMGMAIYDIACAHRLYQRALESGRGQVWKLWEKSIW